MTPTRKSTVFARNTAVGRSTVRFSAVYIRVFERIRRGVGNSRRIVQWRWHSAKQFVSRSISKHVLPSLFLGRCVVHSFGNHKRVLRLSGLRETEIWLARRRFDAAVLKSSLGNNRNYPVERLVKRLYLFNNRSGRCCCSACIWNVERQINLLRICTFGQNKLL